MKPTPVRRILWVIAILIVLGLLNQQVAQACERVTLMAAGLPLTLKEPLR